MPCPPGHIIHHAMPVRPYHLPCHARRAIPYTILCPPKHVIYHAFPASPYHTIYFGMPARPYHTAFNAHQTILCTICDARPALPYTMPCPQCQTVHMPCTPCHAWYHTMPARPYHIRCHALPGHAIYHAMPRQTIPYTMLCPLGHTICHAMSTRPYHIPCHARQTIPYTVRWPVHIFSHAMPARPYHIPFHAHQAILHTITYTMPCPQGDTIYLTMLARSYNIPCHATSNDYFGWSCHLSKSANGLVTRCMIACKWSSAMISLCGSTKFMWKQARIILKVLVVITHRFQTASTIFLREMVVTDFVLVSRSSKDRQVNHNVYFYIKPSSCVLSLLNKQLFSSKLKDFFTNFSPRLKRVWYTFSWHENAVNMP